MVSFKGESMANYAHRLVVVNDISTDCIISGKYRFSINDPECLAEHVFGDIAENFSKNIEQGDVLVAGENFGCGSSREQAPVALKATGLKAILAKSFSRIFYRNAFNVGLCLVECNTDYIDDMDEVEIDLTENIIKNKTKALNIEIKPIPEIMKKFLDKGGIIECIKAKGGFDNILT